MGDRAQPGSSPPSKAEAGELAEGSTQGMDRILCGGQIALKQVLDRLLAAVQHIVLRVLIRFTKGAEYPSRHIATLGRTPHAEPYPKILLVAELLIDGS